MSQTKTYRGRTVAELLPQIRAEFGDDAIILTQREGLSGGVGGFFQRPCVELEVTSGSAAAPSLIDVHDDDEPAMPPAPEPAQPLAFAPADERLARFAEQLHNAPAQAMGRPAASSPAPATPIAPAAPAFRPTVNPQVTDLEPIVDSGDAPVVWPGDEDAAFVPSVFDQVAPAPLPPHRPLPVPAPAPSRSSLAVTSAAWPADAHAAADELADAGLGSDLCTEIVTHALTDLAPFAASDGGALAVKPLVAQALAQRIPVTTLSASTGRAIAFVGPGGAGKTRCVTAIATAYATRSDLPVACVALRAKDDGAELQRALGPAGVPVHGARDAGEARNHIETLRRHSLVIVDTPGVSPRGQGELRVLAADLQALELDEIHLTLPATTGPIAARELVTGTAGLGVTALALTHVDETDVLGPSIAVAVQTRLPLSFVSRGTAATASLRPAVAQELAAAVVG